MSSRPMRESERKCQNLTRRGPRGPSILAWLHQNLLYSTRQATWCEASRPCSPSSGVSHPTRFYFAMDRSPSWTSSYLLSVLLLFFSLGVQRWPLPFSGTWDRAGTQKGTQVFFEMDYHRDQRFLWLPAGHAVFAKPSFLTGSSSGSKFPARGSCPGLSLSTLRWGFPGAGQWK